jgi:hypothetical protein
MSLASDGQIQFLKGVEECKFAQEIIWHELVKNVHTKYTCLYLYIPGSALYVLFFVSLPCLGRKHCQIALEEELGTCTPTVFQGYIMTILQFLLNVVRIRWNNNNSVLNI